MLVACEVLVNSQRFSLEYRRSATHGLFLMFSWGGQREPEPDGQIRTTVVVNDLMGRTPRVYTGFLERQEP